MRVFIIPEDFTKDQHMLQPIIKSLMNYLGQSQTDVLVCPDPRLGGVDAAMNWPNVRSILDRYGYKVDLFLLCVDRDGNEDRRERLDKLESKANNFLAGASKFLAVQAWQETEVWVLAGCSDFASQPNISWNLVREERNPKELYFDPYVRQRGLSARLAGGRKALGSEAAKDYKNRIRTFCHEVEDLETRIKSWLEGKS